MAHLPKSAAQDIEASEPNVRKNEQGGDGIDQRVDGERFGSVANVKKPPVLDTAFIENKLPSGTEYISDVVFKEIDGLELKLDLLLPEKRTDAHLPTAVWIHGGAWTRGNKARDFHRFDQLASRILQEGVALVSIEYRLSDQASFPEPVLDCTDALAFLSRNREKYGLDTDRTIVLGSSAGGHLASLIGTNLTSDHTRFISDPSQPMANIRGVVDFYGPTDLVMLQSKRGEIDFQNDPSPEARFLGHSPLIRPDLARAASPVTYVSANSPPFLIFHGDLDSRVPMLQSIYLDSMLRVNGVESRLVEVEGARHGDEKFDETNYNDIAIEFIRSLLQ